LLGALEARAIKQGNLRCTLSSTETALRFYHANGYAEDGPPDRKYGTGGYPMSRRLTLTASIAGAAARQDLLYKTILCGSGSLETYAPRKPNQWPAVDLGAE